jgi:acetyl-CoA carboxylase biotin carboxyl carrier protein
MFKFEELCKLIRLVGSSGVAMVEIEHAGARLRIDGKAPATVVTAAQATATQFAELPSQAPPAVENALAASPEASSSATAASDSSDGEELHFVTSPIVGTFYRAPNPDADPYVKVGDAVDSGKTLCIVEAMKLMNEIESDQRGTVVKVFPDNAQPVEYGERLFAIRAS